MHVILDSYSTHKTERVQEWLAAHPRWTFHFTPTSSSWMNAVEGIFAKLARRCLQRGEFNSVEVLHTAITQFLAVHNTQEARPFR